MQASEINHLIISPTWAGIAVPKYFVSYREAVNGDSGLLPLYINRCGMCFVAASILLIWFMQAQAGVYCDDEIKTAYTGWCAFELLVFTTRPAVWPSVLWACRPLLIDTRRVLVHVFNGTQVNGAAKSELQFILAAGSEWVALSHVRLRIR